jgi:hypothetical protein
MCQLNIDQSMEEMMYVSGIEIFPLPPNAIVV